MLQTHQKIALSTCVVVGTTYLYLFMRASPDSDETSTSDAFSTSTSTSTSTFTSQQRECDIISLAASVKHTSYEAMESMFPTRHIDHLSCYCGRPDRYNYVYRFGDRFRFDSEENTRDKATRGDFGRGAEEGFKLGNIDVGKKIKGIGGKIKDAGGGIGGEIEKAIKKPIQPIIDFVNRVTNILNGLKNRVTNFESAFKLVGDGIEKEFESIGQSLDLGVHDIFNLVGAAGECGIKFARNLRSCILWYLMDAIGSLIYAVFVQLPLYVAKEVFNLDLYSYVDDLNDALREMDNEIYNLTEFHVMRFPQNVIRDCYSCDVSGQVNKLKDDFEKVIPAYMEEPNILFRQARDKFVAVFT
jgi:hypothetical protein